MLTASLYQVLIWIIWNSETAFVGLFFIFQVWKVFKIKQFLETNWGYIYRSIKSNSIVYLWQIPLLNSWHFPMLEEFTTPQITQHFLLLSIQFSFSKSVRPQKVTLSLCILVESVSTTLLSPHCHFFGSDLPGFPPQSWK